MHGAL